MTARAGLTLRSRVLIGLGAIAAIAVGIALIVTVVTHTFLVGQLDDRLASSSETIGGRGEPRLALECGSGDEDATETDGDRPSDVFRGFVDLAGNCYVFYTPNTVDAANTSPAFDDVTMPTSGSAYLTVPASDGDGQYRVLARATSFGADITALPMDDVEATTRRLVLIEGLGLVAILGGLAVVGWFVISLGVNPMRRMVDASKQIATGDLDVRLEGAGQGSESGELASSLNTMVDTLTDALDERARSEARLREFVADASHELRTPLTTVLGYAELYRRGALARDEDVADAWTRTEAEAGRMRRLVEDMLELARYDAEPQLTPIRLDLAHVCEEVVRDATAAREGVTFALDAPEAVTIEGDPDRLRQAIINVVTNAAVHGGDNVTVRVRRDDAAARVEVVDDGPGMAPDVAGRATERFVRGDQSRARATGGSGLGLAITAAIVAVHGGALEVDSVEGDGTTVRITLPLAPAEGSAGG
ncbi:HAMP domain-containing sensor histidine kinase [Demequina sp. SYSU T00192]|uniref:histidine kinase n=1 Tax=Demequina litoralis TaxID=3051660 RepID=A0ABT8G7U1_9MICO|nr:HAMP domain-containing sensor histidine kinase [Demequina sp. SYSU T00192]MDN4475216.1 HAMP domain-containing sensor histidine kinase [Demequina sp. SYSU T00192]